MNKIIHCVTESRDWEAIYINDKLFADGHSISTSDILSMISEYRNFEKDVHKYEVSDEDMEVLGFLFPSNFNSIPKEVLR